MRFGPVPRGGAEGRGENVHAEDPGEDGHDGGEYCRAAQDRAPEYRVHVRTLPLASAF